MINDDVTSFIPQLLDAIKSVNKLCKGTFSRLAIPNMWCTGNFAAINFLLFQLCGWTECNKQRIVVESSAPAMSAKRCWKIKTFRVFRTFNSKSEPRLVWISLWILEYHQHLKYIGIKFCLHLFQYFCYGLVSSLQCISFKVWKKLYCSEL